MRPGGKRLRIVLDTNVLFSALAFPTESPPSKVLRLIVEGRVDAFHSQFILLITGNLKDLRPLGSFQGIEILTELLKPLDVMTTLWYNHENPGQHSRPGHGERGPIV